MSPAARSQHAYTPGIVHTKAIVLTFALVASLRHTGEAAPEEPIALEPRGLGAGVTYHLQSERRGTKDGQPVDTALTIRSTLTGVAVNSTTPAMSAPGSLLSDGSIQLSGKARGLIAPFNQLQSAFHGMNGANESTMQLQLGDTDVVVPVSVTRSASDGRTTFAFAGQTDASIRSVRAHVVVSVQATVSGGLLIAAAATNDVTARVIFRSVHVQQKWTLTREP
jgi:hypothetical protein